MILLGNTMLGLSVVLDSVLWIAMIIIIAQAVVSWVSPDPRNPIVRFLNAATEPMLKPIRRYVPIVGRIDFSPLILLLLVMFLRVALVGSLHDYGRRFIAG